MRRDRPRRRIWRLATVGFIATALAAAISAVVLNGPNASADVTGPTFATPGLGSDPHVIACNDGATAGYCLYTSYDMGPGSAYPAGCATNNTSCDNYYPMQETHVYFSTTGYNGWSDRGVVFRESTLIAAGWVPSGAVHLWAPSVARVPKPGSATRWDYYLYVPDVSDKSSYGVHHTSRIAVAMSGDGPFGPFNYLTTLPYDSGYMSDPDVLVIMNGRTVVDRIITWADGDWNTCGGFKWARLSSNMTSFATTPAPLTFSTAINPISVLSQQCGTTGNKRPYVEGGSLYNRGFSGYEGWTYLFAAKPDHVPTECTETVAPGQSNKDHEVIAWASSSGPPAGGQPWVWQYKSIVMCGSNSEWTNQATLMSTPNGQLIIIYHDGPAPPNRLRKLHAECLFVSNGYIGGVWRQPLDATNGFNACNTVANNNKYGALHVRDPQYLNYPPIASAVNGVNELAVRRYAVGPYERFMIEPISQGSTTVTFKSIQNGKYVCEPAPGYPLKPACDLSTDSRARFTQTDIGMFGSFKLRAANGKYVGVYGDVKNPNKLLYVDTTGSADAAVFTYLSPNRSGVNQ